MIKPRLLWPEWDKQEYHDIIGLRGCDFKKLTGPGVYYAIRYVDSKCEWLYVGSGRNLMSRISDPTHSKLLQAMAMGGELHLATCRSEKHAREVEAVIIAESKPLLNEVGKSGNSSVARELRESRQYAQTAEA